MYIKENKDAQREINGLILMSFIFYIAYALMVIILYVDKTWVMALGTIVTLVVVFSLISGIMSFFKYYNVLMLRVYKFHIGIFVLEMLCMIFNWYIFNYVKNIEKFDKCIMTLLLELVVIFITCCIYKIEGKIIKSIDARKEKKLSEIYYKKGSEEYVLKINKAKCFLEEKIFRKIFIAFFVYFILLEYSVIVSMYILIMHIMFSVKCNWIYEIIYGKKAKLHNVFTNLIPTLGLIIYSWWYNNIISFPILEYLGAEIFVVIIYLPLICFNMRIYTEVKRMVY